MTPRCSGAGKGRFCCKTMAQYGTVCNICPPQLTMTYMLCHQWHHDGTHVTYDTDIESMTHCPWHHFGVKHGTIWHSVIYVLPTSPWRMCYVTHDTTMALMSPMSQIWTMTPSWQQWHHALLELGKGDFVVRQWHTMAQYVIYVLPTSPWRMLCHQWHHRCHPWHHCPGAGDSGVKQWHNMAQYVIYVLPTSPWRICYVTHDTTMALMSPMTQTWNQWHHQTMTPHCPGAGKGLL